MAPGVLSTRASPHAASSSLPVIRLAPPVPGSSGFGLSEPVVAVISPVRLSRVQGGGLPSGLSSLMVLRKIISLYLVHLFSCDNESDNFRALSISEAGAEVFPCFPVKRSLMSWNPLAPQSLPWEQPCSSPVSPAAVILALGASLAFLDSSQHIFWFTSSFYYSLFPQLSNERNMGNKFSKSVSKYIF